MNCEILSTLYIRSDGDIACNDDAGERILLDSVPRSGEWDVINTFQNANYTSIRSALENGRTPWAEICPACAFYRPLEPAQDSLAFRRIRKIQIEPSLACNLSCPCCSQPHQIQARPKPFIMPVDLFGRALSALANNNFAISEIEYCGQGEPLIHPQFAKLVELTRELFPDAIQRLITNGNFKYSTSIGVHTLDEIYVSCDGVFQDNYQQYRVGGKVEKVFRFMAEAKEARGKRKQALIWKYILFEFNDGDEEIRAAQDKAQELGVDALLFVFTHSRFRSARFTVDNANDLPLYYSNVQTNATPRHYQQERRVIASEHWASPQVSENGEVLLMIDDVTLVDSRLNVRGWVLSKYKLGAVNVSISGRAIGTARHGLPRPDVRAAYPTYDNERSGFVFSAVIPSPASGTVTIGVELLSGENHVAAFERLYIF